MKKKKSTKMSRMQNTYGLIKQSLGGAKLLVMLMVGCITISCDHLSNLDEVIDEKLNQDKENSIRLYKAELHPLNRSGVTGTANFTYVLGGNFQAEVNARNLAPDMVHPQHIHADGQCPPMSAAGEDGLLSIPDGLPFYGAVFIPLDENLVPLMAEDFPQANRHGQLNYAQRTTLRQFMEAFDGDHHENDADDFLNLGHRTVVLHGAYVKDNMIVPAGTEGAVYDASLPVACGEIEEVH